MTTPRPIPEGTVTDGSVGDARIVDVLPHALVVTDATGTILRWNDESERTFGWAEEEVLGRSVFEVLTPVDDLDESRQRFEAARAGEDADGDRTVRRRDGGTVRISSQTARILDDGGEVVAIVGISEDVTERRVAEQAARDLAEHERVLHERLAFLDAIHEALASAPNRSQLMAMVTRAAVPRLGDWCSIHLLPRDQLDVRSATPEVEIAHRDPAMAERARELLAQLPYDPTAPSGIAHVIRTGTVEFHPVIDEATLAATAADDRLRGIVDQLQLRSSITVPLVKGPRVFGAMQFVNAGSSRHYTDGDVSLARAVAGRIASTLENHRLYELHASIADTLQRSLLPATLPDIEGLDISVRYWPAGEVARVGGDFYDVFAIDDECWGLVVGDVCGTGPGAAAVTGMARHTIRASSWHGDDPPTVLRSLNTAIRRADTDSFCTAVFGQLTGGPAGFHLDLACAGHPLPILVGRDGVRTVGGPGTLLGVFDSTDFTREAFVLEPGCALVLYTDGATDVPRGHGLTPEQFLDLVADAARDADDVDEIAEGIHHALAAILPFSERNDDIAVVVLRAAS